MDTMTSTYSMEIIMTRIEIFEDEQETFYSSSVISWASFNREQGVLFIGFLNDDVACYSNISQPLFDSFKNAESAGKFYNQYIKNVKPSHVVEIVDTSARRLTVNTDDAALIQMFYPQVPASAVKSDEPVDAVSRFKIVHLSRSGIELSSRALTLDELNIYINVVVNEFKCVSIKIVEV